MQPLFRDVTDHVRRVQEEIDSLREVLAFAFEASLMTGQAQQTADHPPACGLGGDPRGADRGRRHLRHELRAMPELQWRYGYFLVLTSSSPSARCFTGVQEFQVDLAARPPHAVALGVPGAPRFRASPAHRRRSRNPVRARPCPISLFAGPALGNTRATDARSTKAKIASTSCRITSGVTRASSVGA